MFNNQALKALGQIIIWIVFIALLVFETKYFNNSFLKPDWYRNLLRLLTYTITAGILTVISLMVWGII